MFPDTVEVKDCELDQLTFTIMDEDGATDTLVGTGSSLPGDLSLTTPPFLPGTTRVITADISTAPHIFVTCEVLRVA